MLLHCKRAVKHICPYLTEVEIPLRKIWVPYLVNVKESHFIFTVTPDTLFANWNLHQIKGTLKVNQFKIHRALVFCHDFP